MYTIIAGFIKKTRLMSIVLGGRTKTTITVRVRSWCDRNWCFRKVYDNCRSELKKLLLELFFVNQLCIKKRKKLDRNSINCLGIRVVFCLILNFLFFTIFDNFELAKTIMTFSIPMSNNRNATKHNYMPTWTFSHLTKRLRPNLIATQYDKNRKNNRTWT